MFFYIEKNGMHVWELRVHKFTLDSFVQAIQQAQ